MLEALCKHVRTFALVFVFETGAWSSSQLDLIQTLNMADLPLAPVSHLTALGHVGTRRWHVSGTSEAHPRCSHRTTWHHSPPGWNPWKNQCDWVAWAGLVLGKGTAKSQRFFFPKFGRLPAHAPVIPGRWQQTLAKPWLLPFQFQQSKPPCFTAPYCYSLRAAVADTLNPAASEGWWELEDSTPL